MNLLLLGKAKPSELLVCTFTQKAAFELRDRIASTSRKLSHGGDLSELRVGTIHGVCNQLLQEHRHRTALGNNYETLDELTQLLFLFDYFEEIVGPEENGTYLGKWRTKWSAIEELSKYFNKITEELVELSALKNAADLFPQALSRAYIAYQSKLFDKNKIDFAHQQKLVHDLLLEPEFLKAIASGDVEIKDLVVSKRITKEPRDYQKAGVTAIAAQQLFGSGVKLRPGQTIEYVITDSESAVPNDRVRAFALWEGWHGYDRKKYAAMLREAFQPFELSPREPTPDPPSSGFLPVEDWASSPLFAALRLPRPGE
jgi:hypothetical protein